jgi:hypothetical protein
MASALDTIAHVILPNLMKLKGASVVVSAMERRDVSLFTSVWQQTGIDHTPQVLAKERNETWRIGVLSMPTPHEMGEAYMVAFVAKKNDAAITRYFTLEYDYVNGSPITGDFQTDASAFVEIVMNVISPVSTKKD